MIAAAANATALSAFNAPRFANASPPVAPTNGSFVAPPPRAGHNSSSTLRAYALLPCITTSNCPEFCWCVGAQPGASNDNRAAGGVCQCSGTTSWGG